MAKHTPPNTKAPTVLLFRMAGLLAVAGAAATGALALFTPGTVQAAPPWEPVFAARKQWWSLQPLKPQTVPAVKDSDWSAHPIDRFLLAKMESRQLQPAADAPGRVVCRRLHYILTGLPPSPEESEAFETAYTADPAKAVAESVDRLMTTPRFGETWARHWMDLVRFAETHGSEGDPAIPSAWRYRDYLIRAFNTDVPIDQLIREHIAGDLLPAPRWNKAEGINESVIGTAHFRLVEHGFQPVDSLDEQVRTVDSQIDVLTKAFQGLTVSCARCHDHKFDAVSQKDYTALYGVLSSSRPGQLTIDSPERLTEHDAELTALRGEIRKALADSWQQTAAALPQRLLGQSEREQSLAQARAKATSLQAETGSLEAAARTEARARRSHLADKAAGANSAAILTSLKSGTADGASAAAANGSTTPASAATVENTPPPRPSARWDFDNGSTKDSVTGLTGTLSGGAVIQNGRLVLNGVSSVMTTPPLPEGVTAKTLEAWVSLTSLDQGGGGALTLEKDGGAVFDSLVFAENNPRQWMAGSEFGRRSQSVPAAREISPPGTLVHMACVYDQTGGIRLYRNGQPCGEAYSSVGPVAFPAGSTRVLIGQRHTGGLQAFLPGEVEEARLYNRALTPEEVAASFRAGIEQLPESEWLAAMKPEERSRFDVLRVQQQQAEATLRQLTEGNAVDQAWDKALAESPGDPASPLHAWAALSKNPADAGSGPNAAPSATWEDRINDFIRQNQGSTILGITGGDGQGWRGFGPHVTTENAGGFHIPPAGDRVIDSIDPAGRVTAAVSTRRNGVLVSPRFKLDESLWIRAWGGGNARVRVIVDQYPLGGNATFPEATLKDGPSKWIRFDTAYRKDSWAYLEFATDGDSMLQGANTGSRRSWFGLETAFTCAGKTAPPEPANAAQEFLPQPLPATREAMAAAFAQALSQSVSAWRDGTLTPSGARFLDYFARRGLLPGALPDNTAVARFRQLEEALPEPRRAPGVFETVGFNAPLFTRGDHKKPAGDVPRGYLQALGGLQVNESGSGRLELAEAIAGPDNALTPRVMANRLWLMVFGRGIVATPDDFGKMGSAPANPELLDYLAAQLTKEGWSTKKMLSLLLNTRAFRASSVASEPATVLDPDNTLLTHATVRRLEAEPIRDSLLTIAGQLDSTPGGPGQDPAAPPAAQTRASVYLTIRRTNLPAFLQIFDQPVPFSTTGRRMVTTVPAQSLALLNDPFVLHCAKSAAEHDLRQHPDTAPEARIRRLFETILGRPPQASELADCLSFITPADNDNPAAVWTDLVQSLLNTKEFLYLL